MRVRPLTTSNNITCHIAQQPFTYISFHGIFLALLLPVSSLQFLTNQSWRFIEKKSSHWLETPVFLGISDATAISEGLNGIILLAESEWAFWALTYASMTSQSASNQSVPQGQPEKDSSNIWTSRHVASLNFTCSYMVAFWCFQDIKALFPPECNPFYAGFGNRDTDEISYLKVGIPRGKIFIINPKVNQVL